MDGSNLTQRDVIVSKLLRCKWSRKDAERWADSWLRGVPFNPLIDAYDVEAGTRRYIEATKGKSAVRTLAEIRKWKVDRSSGYLRAVTTAKPRKDSPAKQLAELKRLIAAHGSPELAAKLRDLGA